MAFTPFVETDLPSMANFNEKFSELIGDSTKIATGSYVGTGTWGVDNPTQIILPFRPKLVFLVDKTYPYTTGELYSVSAGSSVHWGDAFAVFVEGANALYAGRYYTGQNSIEACPVKYEMQDNGILLWAEPASDPYYPASIPAIQYNSSSSEYAYIAIGI